MAANLSAQFLLSAALVASIAAPVAAKTPSTELEHRTLEHGGSEYSYFIYVPRFLGRKNKDISASEEIWRFMKHFPS